MQLNADQKILDSQRIDPNDPQGVLSQALRISAYDEFDAYNTYNNVMAKFGNVMPFANIINSEINHYNEVITLMQKYGVEAPIVQETQIELPDTLQECCEIAVSAEIDNISLYNHLLTYVNEPDVRDLFYRIQAASYNNHLPAFRAAVASFYNANSNPDTNVNNLMDNMADYQGMIEDVMNGNVDQNKIMSMLGNANMSLLGGLAVGALAGMSINNLINNNKEEQE